MVFNLKILHDYYKKSNNRKVWIEKCGNYLHSIQPNSQGYPQLNDIYTSILFSVYIQAFKYINMYLCFYIYAYMYIQMYAHVIYVYIHM